MARPTMLATRILRGSAADDRAASFATLTDRQLDDAYRLAAVILGDAIEAEDAVHDAAVAAWRSFGQLRDATRFEAWFTRIIVNGCRDRLRARRRHVVVDLGRDLARVAADVPEPDRAVSDRDALARAFEVLDPDERVVLALRYWHDLTVDQIADRIGAPAGTVKSRLHRAIGRLGTALRAEEVRR